MMREWQRLEVNYIYYSLLSLASHGEEELELWRQLVLGIEAIWEVNSSDPAVCMNLHSQGLNVVGSIGTTSEVGQVELNLIPAFVQTHGHRANEGLHTGRWLVVWCAESASHVFVVKHLHLECKVFLQVLDDHDQEGKLDAESLVSVCGACDVICWHVRSHDFEDTTLNVGVGNTLDVTVSHAFVPNLKRLGPDRV